MVLDRELARDQQLAFAEARHPYREYAKDALRISASRRAPLRLNHRGGFNGTQTVLYVSHPRAARQVVAELVANGISRADIHTVARDAGSLAELPTATPEQRDDRIWRLEGLYWNLNADRPAGSSGYNPGSRQKLGSGRPVISNSSQTAYRRQTCACSSTFRCRLSLSIPW
jgi:hypothetical protein